MLAPLHHDGSSAADRALGYIRPAASDLGRVRSSRHHMLRLGMQGVELLADGTLTLPMSAPRLDILNAVRAGEWLLADVLALAAVYETQLTELATTSALPEHPDAAKLDALLADTYDAAWAR